MNGGRRYTPVDEAKSQLTGEEEFDRNAIFGKQHPAYYRFDVRIAVKMQSKRVTQEWGIDVQNVTNRQNIFNQSYDVDTNTYSTSTQTGLFPIPFYRITF